MIAISGSPGPQASSHAVNINEICEEGDCGIYTGPGSDKLNKPCVPPVVEGWDPATGKVTPVASTPAKTGFVSVKLALKPYETKLITIK